VIVGSRFSFGFVDIRHRVAHRERRTVGDDGRETIRAANLECPCAWIVQIRTHTQVALFVALPKLHSVVLVVKADADVL
jgi:hypothetical protein